MRGCSSRARSGSSGPRPGASGAGPPATSPRAASSPRARFVRHVPPGRRGSRDGRRSSERAPARRRRPAGRLRPDGRSAHDESPSRRSRARRAQPVRGRRSLVSSTTRSRWRAYCRLDGLARLVGHEPADRHAADAHAERDRRGVAGRLDRRLGRRRLGRRRRRRGRLGRLRSTGARRRGQPESCCKSKESAGGQNSRAQRASRRCHAGSVDTAADANMRGSFVTTASTPARSTRASSTGSSTVHVTTAAPRAWAARTHARRHERVVGHEVGRAGEREQRADEERRHPAQDAQADARDRCAATRRRRSGRSAAES